MAGSIPGLVGAAAGRPAHRGRPRKARTEEHQMTKSTQEHWMSDNTGRRTRVLGRLRSADGTGVVRIEDRYDTDIDDLWSAPHRSPPPSPLVRRGRGRPPPRRGVQPVRRSRWLARGRAGTGVRTPAAAAGGDQGNRRVLAARWWRAAFD